MESSATETPLTLAAATVRAQKALSAGQGPTRRQLGTRQNVQQAGPVVTARPTSLTTQPFDLPATLRSTRANAVLSVFSRHLVLISFHFPSTLALALDAAHARPGPVRRLGDPPPHAVSAAATLQATGRLGGQVASV